MIVTAMTFNDTEYDVPPYEVTGELKSWYVRTLRYIQYEVGGVPVDPKTLPKEVIGIVTEKETLPPE
jgi:hypothetical protein